MWLMAFCITAACFTSRALTQPPEITASGNLGMFVVVHCDEPVVATFVHPHFRAVIGSHLSAHEGQNALEPTRGRDLNLCVTNRAADHAELALLRTWGRVTHRAGRRASGMIRR